MTSYVLTYRLVKGSPITEAEFDANIHNLDDRIVVIEAEMPPVSVVDAEITSAGHLDIILSNSTTIDAGALPVSGFAEQFKGTWTASTFYSANDLFTAPGSNWLGVVLIDHTSDLTFDWAANDGMGHDDYAIVIPFAPNPTTTTLAVTDHTLTLDDINTYIRSTATSTAGINTITIPTDAAVPIPVNSEVNFCQRGDPITFVATGGVTLNYPVDVNPTTALIGAVVTLKKVATNEWDLFGRLELVSA